MVPRRTASQRDDFVGPRRMRLLRKPDVSIWHRRGEPLAPGWSCVTECNLHQAGGKRNLLMTLRGLDTGQLS